MFADVCLSSLSKPFKKLSVWLYVLKYTPKAGTTYRKPEYTYMYIVMYIVRGIYIVLLPTFSEGSGYEALI